MNNHCSIGCHSRAGGKPVNNTILRSRPCHASVSLREGGSASGIPATAGMMAQHGFSIVSAIFLLVVLSFLGIAMVSFFTSQHQSAAMDVLGSRAYQAARTGIEWAAYQVDQSPVSSPTPATCATNFAPGSLGGTLSSFAVEVACTPTSYIENGSTVWVYDITASAVTGGVPGDPDYVERVLTAKLGK